MKKKLVALTLAAMLCVSSSATVFAASSTTNSNSGNQAQTVEEAKPGQAVNETKIQVAVQSADGTVQAVSLDKVVAQTTTSITTAIAEAAANAAATGTGNVGNSLQNIMTSPVSTVFTQTVAALSEMKGGNVVVNNCGTVKTAASAKDALGNTIASAGIIKNVQPGALVLLMSVNEDGTIEYVEGIVDPLTGSVLGAFKGTPKALTVMVLA